MDVTTANNQGVELNQDMLADGTHTHKQNIEAHLDLIDIILKQGERWLTESSVDDIWRILVTNCSNQADKDMVFNWFMKCLGIDAIDPSSYGHVYGKLISYRGPRTSSYNNVTDAFEEVQNN